MIKKITVMVLFLMLLGNLHAQCDNTLLDSCRVKLQGATFMKDFKIRLQKGSRGKLPPAITFSVYLNKGNHYRITMHSSIENKTIGISTLADELRTYVCSYNKEKDENINTFDFFCKKTQIYYLSIYFKDGKEGCAAMMLGLVESFDPDSQY